MQNKGDDIWMFYKAVQTEVSAIKKVFPEMYSVNRQAVADGEHTRVKSSNYKYLMEVWRVARNVPQVYAMQKFVPYGPFSTKERFSTRSKKHRDVETAPTVQIEVIAGDVCSARYFLKISTIDDNRLGHDLNRLLWDEYDSGEEESECAEQTKAIKKEQCIKNIPIAQTARELVMAAMLAGTTPILVLPFLSKDNKDGLLDYLDSIGLRYHCKTDPYPIFNYAPGIPVPNLQSNLPPRRIALDITTLLSVVADVCNMLPNAIQYDKDTHAQVDQANWESHQPILPNVIFPFLNSADELIAPPGVVSKMNKLLATIGSDEERQRAAVLMGTTTNPLESLIEQYNKLTIYPIPETVCLPIKIVAPAEGFVSPLTEDDIEKLSDEATEVFNLAISLSEGSEVATANKQLAKMVRSHYFMERNPMGVAGRVLLHQPRSLRGFGKLVHLPTKGLPSGKE